MNLADPESREALLRLAAAADIFITNFQPQLQRKFRLEYADLAAINPRLIYASRHRVRRKRGRRRKARLRRDRLLGPQRPDVLMHSGDAEPVQSPAGLGDHPTAVSLFSPASCSLCISARSPAAATKVTTSLMANGAWANACAIQAALCGAHFHPKWTRATAINPLVNHYVARDGHRIFLCLLDQIRDWPNLCRALGFPELIDDARFSTVEPARQPSALIAMMDRVIAQHDLPTGRATSSSTISSGVRCPRRPKSRAIRKCKPNGVFAEIRPGLSTIQNPINVAGLDKQPPRMAPELGRHTREILRSAGYCDDEIAAMIARGAAAEASG